MTVAYTPGSIFSLAQFHSQTLALRLRPLWMCHPVGRGSVCGAPEDLSTRSDTHEAAAMSFYGDSPEEVLHDVQTSQGPLPRGSRTLSIALSCSPTVQPQAELSADLSVSVLALPQLCWCSVLLASHYQEHGDKCSHTSAPIQMLMLP